MPTGENIQVKCAAEGAVRDAMEMAGVDASFFDDLQGELVQEVAKYSLDPLGFVKFAYPWGTGELVGVGQDRPRVWQAKVLKIIGEHLKNLETRFQPCRIARASGHDIGKGALAAMVKDWGMSTLEETKVVITANTEPQLRTKTWPEIAKWSRNCITAHWWKFEETSIHSKSPGFERTWRADRITWSEHNTEAFAGLHNKGKRIVIIFDEASAIHDKVWEVTEGALVDEGTEIIWLVLGNPTQGTGRFRECFGKQKHRWYTMQIDARDVEGTNKEYLAGCIEDYGEDSDFGRTRVRGEFPRTGSNQFISPDDVAACRKYTAEHYKDLPKVLAVDVARFGSDQTVVDIRQGRKLECLGKWRGKDTAQVTALVADQINLHQPKAVVVDSDGVGSAVFDGLKFLGYGRLLVDFHGGKPANKPEAFFNRRAEVWGLLRDALKAGMEIPNDPELAADLTGPEYGFSSKQQLQLEKKDDMKRRGLSSPDCGDAAAMTFAVELAPSAPKRPPTPVFVELGRKSSQEWMRG